MAGIGSWDKAAARPSGEAPPIVAVHLADGAALLARYTREGDRDILFCPEAIAVGRGVGQKVVLDIFFDHSGYAFRVTGTVISRRLTQSEALRSGARVAFEAADEAPLRAMILGHARGKDIEYRSRVGPRIHCRFGVRVHQPLHPAQRGEVVDLSAGGARLVGLEPAPLGTLLQLKLHPPGAVLGLPVLGRVVWQRPGTPADATPPATPSATPSATPGEPADQSAAALAPVCEIGIEFQLDRPRIRRRIAELVARLGNRLAEEADDRALD